MFHHYRRLIDLRHREPVVVDGDYRLLLADDAQVWAYVRTLGHARLLVAANLSSQPASADLGGDAVLLDGEVLVSSGAAGSDVPEAALGRVLLAPWEARAVVTR